mmetsp:Transcript_59279/g.157792  ORF Transcript_59279/g.157792 Transcript_59279/m.157792 type:complete len:223 (-) Transcript_59279:4906-5574(-)
MVPTLCWVPPRIPARIFTCSAGHFESCVTPLTGHGGTTSAMSGTLSHLRLSGKLSSLGIGLNTDSVATEVPTFSIPRSEAAAARLLPSLFNMTSDATVLPDAPSLRPRVHSDDGSPGDTVNFPGESPATARSRFDAIEARLPARSRSSAVPLGESSELSLTNSHNRAQSLLFLIIAAAAAASWRAPVPRLNGEGPGSSAPVSAMLALAHSDLDTSPATPVAG